MGRLYALSSCNGGLLFGLAVAPGAPKRLRQILSYGRTAGVSIERPVPRHVT